MTTVDVRTRRAAGGVLWRTDDAGEELEVAVVHRPRYDDWSLPKGKLETGEHPLVAAVREVAEETGFTGRPGRTLGTVSYAGKSVDYWSMTALGGQFEVNEEVDKLRWLPPKAAAKRLSYGTDRTVLRTFAAEPAALTTLLLVRHGSAGQRSEWSGTDADRPLDKVGEQQADDIAAVLRWYVPTEVVAASRVRCVQTVAPLAEALDLPLATDEAFTEEAHAIDGSQAERLLRDLGKRGEPVALCSQGGLIPDVVASLAARDGIALHRPRSRKGSVWALHLRRTHLVAADYFPDLQPGTSPHSTSRPARKG